jgi:hypothetical protein
MPAPLARRYALPEIHKPFEVTMDLFQNRRVQISDALSTIRYHDRGLLQNPPRNLRKPRHSGIFEAIHRLDAPLDPTARAALARWIRDEYDTEFGDVPVGFVAQCYLGRPLVDHRLYLFQSIVEHYAAADPMPEPFAQARMLVRTHAYDFVEVYVDGELRPVFPDGSVVA